MKLAFVWAARYATREVLNWEDGLWLALNLLAERDGWEVRIFAPCGQAWVKRRSVSIVQAPTSEAVIGEVDQFGPHAILCWGSLDRPLHAVVRELGVPTALCFAGGATQHPNLNSFDHVFVESDYHLRQFRKQGISVSKAFGVNTEIFCPNDWQNPHYLAILPAAFAQYKRYDLFAKAFGSDGLAVGQVQLQDDGTVHEAEQCHQMCLNHGVSVFPRIVPYYTMPYFFGMAKTAALPSTTLGGCDRTVLEALACGKPAIVCWDNAKLPEFVPSEDFVCEPEPKALRSKALELADMERGPLVEFVQRRFTHEHYAEQLKHGLEALV